ncbi:MAG: HDOD domain-containing protein [Candidatus Latescibacteria bacterium]|nr:HDOD domain-containing protein [bacterium]MBD3424839.1 HDOD domain-containing protein [Candidatus Latescibacterota bacterium]
MFICIIKPAYLNIFLNFCPVQTIIFLSVYMRSDSTDSLLGKGESGLPAVEIEKMLERIREIPPMPESIVHLMEISNSNKYFTREFSAIIESDPSLTASILKVANSAYAAQNREITSVKEAVTILGKNMVVSTAIRSFSGKFFDRKLAGYGGGGQSLWKHSFATAIAASEVAGCGKAIDTETSFTAGILHDVGKVLISEHMSGHEEVLSRKLDESTVNDYLALERSILGTDHCEVGALLAENWKLPEALVESIRCHHHPSLAERPGRDIVSAVHLGDILAMEIGVSTGSDCMCYRMDRTVIDILQISENDMEKLRDRVKSKYQRRLAMYSWG